jgi:hypothetical protein
MPELSASQVKPCRKRGGEVCNSKVGVFNFLLKAPRAPNWPAHLARVDIHHLQLCWLAPTRTTPPFMPPPPLCARPCQTSRLTFPAYTFIRSTFAGLPTSGTRVSSGPCWVLPSKGSVKGLQQQQQQQQQQQAVSNDGRSLRALLGAAITEIGESAAAAAAAAVVSAAVLQGSLLHTLNVLPDCLVQSCKVEEDNPPCLSWVNLPPPPRPPLRMRAHTSVPAVP